VGSVGRTGRARDRAGAPGTWPMISVSGTAPESQLSLVGGEVGDKESERESIEPVAEVVALNAALWTSS
jgi:hypothetical protein